MKTETKNGIRPRYDGDGNLTGWQAIVRETDHLGKEHYKCRTFSIIKGFTKGHAKTWQKNTRDKIRKGEFETQNKLVKLTVADLMANQLNGPSKKNKDGGERDRSLAAHVNRIFNDVTLAAIGPMSLFEYARKRHEDEGASQSTVRKELSLFGRAWGLYMLKIGIEKNNPKVMADKIIAGEKLLPKDKRCDVRPTHDEFEALISYSHRYATLINKIIEFAALEGLRAAEIARMRPEHRKGRFGELLFIPETKTNVPRTIKLFPRSIEILNSLPAQLDGTIWGISSGGISQGFKRIKNDLGFTHLKFHTMRHEACSRMADMGMPILYISAKSGHEDLRSVKRYIRLNIDDDAKDYALNLSGLTTPALMKRYHVPVDETVENTLRLVNAG